MAKKTKESVRRDILSSFFSEENAAREQERIRLEMEERQLRRAQEEEARAARPSFSGVTTSVDTTGGDPSTSEPSGLDSLLGRLGTAVSGGWDSTVGGGMRQAGARLYTSGDTSSGYPSLLEMLPSTSLLASAYEAIPDEYKKGVGAGMFRKGGAQAQEAYTAMEEAFPVAGGAVADALASPSSHISILGGPVGAAVGFQSAFDSTYTQGRLDGLSEGEAAALATGDGIIEGGMSIIPTGKYLDKLPGMDKMAGPLKDYLKGRLANVATRVGKTMAGEAVQEGATEIGQLAWQKLMAEAGPTEKLQEYSKEQLPATTTEFWDQVMRAAKAGAAGGGMIQTPTTILQDMQQSGKIAGDVLNMYTNEQKDNRPIPSNEAGPAVPPVTEQAAEIRAAQEDLAWQARDEERANEQVQQTRLDNQADLRNSFVSQVDTARSRVEAAQDSIEAGDTSQSTLNEALSAQRQLERAEARLSSFEASMAAPAVTPEVPATTPRLDVYGEPVGPAMPADVRAKQESVREDVRKSIEARQAREQKAKENAHKKARKAFIDEQLEANANLPAEQQETAVTRAALEWDNNNPVDTFVPAEKPKTGRRTTTPKATTAEAPKITAAEQLAQMRKEAGFSSLTSTDNGSDTQLSSREVAEAVVEKMGKGDNRKAAVLLAEGKVALVDNAADIPSGAVETNTGAFYDAKTGQTYVVANNLQKGKPIVGQLLDRAAHEFKHAGDLSGNADLQGGGLSKFIGVENNEKIVSQIEDAAAKGDPVAMRALERAKNATQDKPTYTLELPAYFVEESRSARRNSTVVNNITRNILSATRSTVKGIIPGDYEVNLNDVAYLSDKLIERTALTQGSLAATGANAERAGFSSEGLNMIQGPTSARFKEAQDNGWVYESMDGKEKFVTSDAGSTMDRDSVKQMTGWSGGDAMRASDLIIHKELFADYPQLADLSIGINTDLPARSGVFNAATATTPDQISISPDMFKKALTSRQDMDALRGLILHEMQHAVQEIENSARGGNQTMFRTPEDRRMQAELGKKLEKFNTARSNAIKMLRDTNSSVPADNRQMLLDTILEYNNRGMSLAEVTADLQAEIDLMPEGPAKKTMKKVVRSTDGIVDLQVPLRESGQRSFLDYMDLLGEREARFTQDNLNQSQDKLPTNPEDVEDNRGFAGEANTQARAYTGEATLRMTDEDTDASVFRRASVNQKPNLEGLASESPVYNVPSLPQSDAPGRARVIGRLLGRAFLSDGGVPTDIAEAVRFAHNSQAGEALNSNILTNNMDLALRSAQQELAKRGTKKTQDQLREELFADIDEINELPTREERSAAVKKLDEKYPIRTDALRTASPKLSDAIFAIQEAKRALTREIIALRAENPTPLTDKEVAIFNKMMANDERYITRTYLATYNKEIGKEYAERLIERAQADNTSEEARVVSNAVEYLIENDLLVPDKEALMRSPIEKVRHMYEAWGLGNGNIYTSRDGKETMVDALQEKVGASRAEMEALAMDSIMDMLGLGAAPKKGRKDVLKTARADQTIVSARKDMPAPLRELLGEITDPVLQEKLTLNRMGSFVAKTRLMNELYERGEGRYWSDTQTDLFTEQMGKDAGFGPLGGKFLHPDLHYALSTVMSTHDTLTQEIGEAIRNPAIATLLVGGTLQKAMRNVIGVQKSAQVVINPANMILNLMGSPLVAMANGIGPLTGAKGFAAASVALAADISLNAVINDTAHNIAVEMAKAGALDTASVGMFQSDFFKGVQKELRAQIARGEPADFRKAAWARAKEAGTFTKDTVRNLYALMDVWTKTATYINRKDFWTKMNEYENLGLNEEAIKRKAGWDASTTNISYDRAIPAARALEQNTPFAVFATYFAEAMIRVPLMNFVQAGRDFTTAANATTPEGRRLAAAAGTKRLMGTLLATAGVISATMLALDSEDEDKKAARALDPDYYRNAIMVPIGTDNEGRPRYYSLSRADTLGPLNEMAVAVLRADDGRKLETFNEELRNLFIDARSIMDIARIINDAAAEATGNPEWDKKGKTSWIKKSFPDFFNTMTQLENDGDIPENLFTLIDTLTPTLFKGAVDDERDVIGFKPYVRDAEKSMGFRIYDYDKAVKKQRSNFQSFLEGNPTPDQVLRRMNGIVEKEKPAFDDLSKAVNGLLASQKHEGKPELGKYTLSDGARIFRKEKKADIYRYAVRGEFKSSVIDPKELTKWYKRQMKRKDVDRKQLNETYRMALKSYRDVMMKDNDNED